MMKKIKQLLGEVPKKTRAAWERLDKSGKVLTASLGTIALLILLFIALPDRRKELPPQPVLSVPVEVIEAIEKDRPDMIVLPGLVLAHVDATLAAEKAGRVVELLAERGQSVTNGEVLLRLDDRTARVTFEDAARNLERFEKLSGTGAVSQKNLDDIRKAHDLAETALSYCTVKSPTDGIVNERYVEEGEYVLPGTPVFDVVSIDPVRVSVDIPERSLAALKTGDPVEFTVLSLPGRVFKADTSYVSAKADLGNNAFRVELTLPNPDRLLRPGMIASVQHRRGQLDQSIGVPLEAVIPQKGDHVVFLVRDGHAVRQIVRIDTILEEEAIILSGIEPGDRVVTRGNRMLNDGTKVEVQGTK